MRILISISLLFSICTTLNAESPCAYLCESIPDQNDVMSFWGQASREALKASKIRILVWNIYKERKDRFREDFIKLSQNQDVLFLQEQSLESENFEFFRSFNQFRWDHATQFYMKDRVRTGVGTASRVKSIKNGFFRSKIIEPFVKSPKLIVYTYYRLDSGDTLLTLNIHGMNARGVEGLRAQIIEALPLIRRHKGPVIFAGDFNTKNSERLNYLDSELKGVGLARARLESGESDNLLDHIYTRSLLVQNLQYMNAPGSDHPAITTNLISIY